jgi:Peptidase A4 family
MPGLHTRSNVIRRIAISLIAFSLTPPCKVSAQIQLVDPGEPLSSGSSPNRVYQPGWAGYIIYAPGQVPLQIPQNRFQTIEADWTVPSAVPTINCDDKHEQTDGSSIWIGLDGWSSTFTGPDGSISSDVLQAGTETDVPCWNGISLPATAYFWIEWDGTQNIPVTKGHQTLPLKPGDQIHVRITANTTKPSPWRRATVYFEDKTTHQSYTTTFDSGCVICSGSHREWATLFGNTAEWVVETTFYSSGHSSWPNTLDNFGKVEVTNISVTDDQGITYTPGDPGAAGQEIDWMTWKGRPLADGDTLLACAAITGSRAMTLSRAPYKIVTPGHQGWLEPKPKNCDGTIQPPPSPETDAALSLR